MLVLAVAALAAELTHGPMVGHVSDAEVHLWARVLGDEPVAAVLEWSDGTQSNVLTPDPASDSCMTWTFSGLPSDTSCRYTIRAGEAILAGGTLRTAPEPETTASQTIAFVSCADEDEPTGTAWRRMRMRMPDAVVLLGDTPYIDSTNLDHQRARYRAFSAAPEFARLMREVSTYGTWDDHDIGRNDTNGVLDGKERSRQAFMEYRANRSFGEGDDGVYTSFRRGPVEVFVLDTRWFAGTEGAISDPEGVTLLGAAQWAWLERGLRESTAPCKILACGMIWNDATRPGKTDHWGRYPHEREALFRFIGDNEIEGVVLVGGDIHWSRVVRHDAGELAGRDLIEFIVSPLHDRLISAADAPHPGVVWSKGIPHVFLEIEADRDGVKARFVDRDDVVHIELNAFDASSSP